MRLSKTVHAALVAGIGLALFACSSEDTAGPPPAPQVSGLSQTVAFPGDTLVISGSNFIATPSANQVEFASPLARRAPFAATSTQLRVIVDWDALTGPITVLHEGGSDTGPALEVQRGIGDVFVYPLLDEENELVLPNPTATTRYLIIPFATNPDVPYNTEHAFQINSESAAPAMSAETAGLPASARSRSLHGEFEAWRWQQVDDMVAKVGVPNRRVDPEMSAQSQVLGGSEFRQFYVLNTTTGSVTSPSSYELITARLRYTGTKCLVYSDVDTLATGNLTDTHMTEMGQAFDTSIEPTNVTYFGGYSDVDDNDKVIILSTPVVNQLTPPGAGGFIAGFFLSIDLYSPPQVPNGTTNRGEVFYLLAADPAGVWGNTFPTQFTADENIATTAHEHEHMISFSHRIFNQGGATQRTWLEEGMAHMAEDLNGYVDQNEARGALYLDAPNEISLEHNTAPLEQRGGIYLFLRLMSDRYGTDILKKIVQSKCTGRDCIQQVTGQGYYDLVAEFLAALYISGRGITADERFNYATLDLNDFGGGVAFEQSVAGGLFRSGTLRPASGKHYVFSGAIGTESRFVFLDLLRNARLRHVIVRVQ